MLNSVERYVCQLTWFSTAIPEGPVTVQRYRVKARGDRDQVEREIAAIALYAEDPDNQERGAEVESFKATESEWQAAEEHSYDLRPRA